ncbi:MAG: hypothetical protein A3J65_00445 [Candidatus Buchananbacteria bacterium RIFCSPHIGHO2_02_FULL_45_11b]|uniref:Uncharacterized protein n=4 Tax=Candidatus Buchananiibacteriota TaxID=1817903 RepID=A0A1G1YBX7_9BACT|nr:MAG: hypothetical protein A2663_01160 [Candidatus Buchananbacteria bacterium RIFCSPHIGHO2_01_FULL_46_12]OGY49799.1 MAG: hypothetical protein A3J65_00445 [Candidatus Buchananbacteria bacterium RIFCSPHIGHO2_02_FULL_45_11b]OGY53614.1 MAG: hypothetical protein A3B15_03515 [Candidatus Buchananbacteria bacterium RIFCSPLOWO2_01_FULL_45_31]OGY57369.1 MAG: hypothetical protein A3H67_04495 [Candidatus Buchananbacteria bacterium RIFCSPLOWO2_02_FULL_46_11b]
MPYLSNNYRFQPKSKLQNLLEAASFLVLSAGAILLTLFLLGWFSAAAVNNGLVAGADYEANQIIEP